MAAPANGRRHATSIDGSDNLNYSLPVTQNPPEGFVRDLAL